ncbi:MAG: hypothetical protein HYU66_12055 [Armatimonadetes bacterium]|nr:hypothetical protein [Armatimonadota bacterium]
MKRFRRIVVSTLTVLALAAGLSACSGGSGTAAIVTRLTNLFFLHHSVGDGLVVAGNMRAAVAAYNTANGTNFTFWDHGYNGDGLRNAAGVSTGTNYDVPDDNLDPDGYFRLWTGTDAAAVACRNLILNNHQVIVFKSCFTTSTIADAAELQNRQDWYLAMRNFFDTRPDRLFIVVTAPPVHHLDTTTTQADYSRALAGWLSSSTFLSGHPNVRCFDLFDRLANVDDGSATANMLRTEYEDDPQGTDSHPNALANTTLGPILAQFICAAAAGYAVPAR